MADKKLVKTVMDGFVVMRLITGIGWVGKKVLKQNFISDSSSSFMNYQQSSVVAAGAIGLKTYLEDRKIIPSNV